MYYTLIWSLTKFESSLFIKVNKFKFKYFIPIIVSPDESQGYLGFSTVTPPPQRFPFGRDNLKNIFVRPFKFGMLSNSQNMFRITKSWLEIFLAAFWKTRWPPRAFLCQSWKVLISPLLLLLEVWDGKPTYRKSWAGNLLVLSDLTLDPSFKVKRG